MCDVCGFAITLNMVYFDQLWNKITTEQTLNILFYVSWPTGELQTVAFIREGPRDNTEGNNIHSSSNIKATFFIKHTRCTTDKQNPSHKVI